MGSLIRKMDWSKTSIGPSESWSPTLRMMLRFLLANRFPLLLWWGPQYVSIYNDAYRPVLGAKHPRALGQPVSECWSEIWHILKPLIDTPFNGGPATWNDDILLEINRYGFIEETHFTIAYSPVPDETAPNGIGGVLATVHEISEKVIGERRAMALRDLGARVGEAKTAEEACALAAETLTKHSKDIPFALFYLIDPDGKRVHLAGASGVVQGGPASPLEIELSRAAEQEVWPLTETVLTETMQVVGDLARLGEAVAPGPWPDRPRKAVAVPIPSNISHQLAGVLVLGVSARLKLDDLYRSFFELVATQIATSVANARAYDEERKRAEALAEIDRAKTAFFSNVSHEFRTPLTLILGPAEDALADSSTTAANRQRMEVVYRNSLRLLKLVNTLLDFSRIEAGRVKATYEPTDLSKFTGELASVFRAAVERAGLRLVVGCPKLPQPVFVDREMWENVVFNLLSNSFKSTFEGEIVVKVHNKNDHAELVVRDTGTGIPENEIPHLFERFRRVEGARRRTHEGSGIGLALVQEMVKAHGGSIAVASTLRRGTTFRICIPYGTSHLPKGKIKNEHQTEYDPKGAAAYVHELLSWLPTPDDDEDNEDNDMPPAIDALELDSKNRTFDNGEARILVVDDNPDMRNYLRQLLNSRFTVIPADNGRTALESALKVNPDLVLTDVMMPEMDGFQLLAALRQHSSTQTVPVIMVSARAGEESRVEGFEAGADDYLVKPFSARELLTRVESQIRMARFRENAIKRHQELEQQVQQSHQLVAEAVENIHDGFLTLDSNWRFTTVNPAAESMSHCSKEQIIGQTLWELFPDVRNTELERRYRNAMQQRTRDAFEFFFEPWQRWYSLRISPSPDGGLAIYSAEITAQKRAQEDLRLKEEHLRLTQQAAKIGSWELDVDEEEITISPEFAEAVGLPAYVSRLRYADFISTLFLSSDRNSLERAMTKALRANKEFRIEARLRRPDGDARLVSLRGKAFHNQSRLIVLGVLIDLTPAESARRSKQRSREAT